MGMKINTFFRHIKEGTKNVVRNGWMTFASISAVTTTLLILGIVIIFAMNMNYMADRIDQQVEIEVFLKLDIAKEQVGQIEKQIRNLPSVKEVKYISKEEGLKILKNSLKDHSDILQGLEQENPLMDSFLVKVFNPQEDLAKTATEIKNIVGVDEVDYGKQVVDKLFMITNWVRNIGFIFILALAFTTMFLISNTIKITIFSRRRDIEIMRLVGATNNFIRFPFFVEGLLLGVIGAIIPIIVLISSYNYLLQQSSKYQLISLIELLPLYPFAYQIAAILLLIGAFIGVWGSLISVRRFLKV